ncbi:MAG: CehA/McbA family metallohydrolase [Clostridiales bacterium]|nr:CehA/McbA family metallohydrolase [Clostridiales bacterium]
MRQLAFEGKGKFYKGNLHAHTEISDGKRPVAEVVDIYKNLGYDFLAITDHNILFKSDEFNDILYIVPGLEIHSVEPNSARTHHMVALTTYDNGKISHGQVFNNVEWTDSVQSLNGVCNMMVPEGFQMIYCHSMWSRTEPNEFRNPKLMAMEIYNGVCDVMCDQGYQLTHWDNILRSGMKMWGIASDDCHGMDSHYGRGFVMVKSQNLTDHGILKALKDGAFYASQGPEIYDFYIEGENAVVKCSPAMKITFITYEYRGRCFRYDSPATEASMIFNKGINYIRVEITDENGKKAWTNPLFLK